MGYGVAALSGASGTGIAYWRSGGSSSCLAALPDDKGKPRETVGRKATGRYPKNRVVTAGLPEATMVAPTDRRPNAQLGPWPKQEPIALADVWPGPVHY